MNSIVTKINEERPMTRVLTGLTLETLPRAVLDAGIGPDQRLTVIVESSNREIAFANMQRIAERVGRRVAADGLTEEDVIRQLADEDR